MLLSFRFANHRSFRYEQQLNLTRVYDRQGDESAHTDAVQVIGIFGANASGKSNCLQALHYMRRMVAFSDREVEPGLGLNREPFRLDQEGLRDPSRYVVDLSLGGTRYTYGFTVDSERVLEEWLYYYPKHRKRRVFERDREEFSWGEESGKNPSLEQIAEITASTALFISTVARFNRRPSRPDEEQAEPLHSVYMWFRRIHGRVDLGSRLPRLPPSHLFPTSEDNRRVIVDLLRAADVGIVDVTMKSTAATEDPPLAPDELRKERRLQFTHRGPSGNVVMELADESTGTRQLLDLAIDAAVTLRNGDTMIVDEIDASLHPLLTAKLIGLFQSGVSNPHGSQLIFTSHDAALLGTFDGDEILHRDEIWFAEKDDDGASVVYPLTDFKPRRAGENRQRRYLNGNYGGTPDLSFTLFERALAGRKEEDG